MIFLLLGAGALMAERLFSGAAVPALVRRMAASKVNPAFWQMVILRVQLLKFFAAGSALTALAALVVPTDRWSLKSLLVTIFLLSAAVRFATPDMALDSVPRPDGLYYNALAMSLVRDGSWQIPIGAHRLPSRFGPGTSLVMCLSQWLRPGTPGWGVFGILLCGIGAIAMAYTLGARLFSKETGVVAALLVATSPSHAYYSRQLMSEVPWGLFILAAFGFLLAGSSNDWKILAGGFLLGLGMLFKPPHIAVVAGVGLLFLFTLLRSPRAHFRICLAAGLGTAAGLVPWFLYNRLVLGEWLTNGYRLYDTNRYALGAVFSPHYLLGPPIEKGFTGNIPYYALTFLGLELRPERMPWALPIAWLAIASLFAARRPRGEAGLCPPGRNFLGAVALISALFIGMLVFYYYQDVRLLLPVLPLVLVAAAVPLTRLFLRFNAGARNLLAALAALTLAATGLAILRVEASGMRTHDRVLWERLAEASRDYDAIFSDEEPILLSQYGVWTADRPLIPFLPHPEDWFAPDPWQYRRDHGTFRYHVEGALELLRPLVRQKKRVGVWIRFPHVYQPLYDSFRAGFETRPRPAYGIPGFEEITGAVQATVP